jgi:hypothetical protein
MPSQSNEAVPNGVDFRLRKSSQFSSSSTNEDDENSGKNYCACSCCLGEGCQLVDIGVFDVKETGIHCNSQSCGRQYPEQCQAKASIVAYLTTKTNQDFLAAALQRSQKVFASNKQPTSSSDNDKKLDGDGGGGSGDSNTGAGKQAVQVTAGKKQK